MNLDNLRASSNAQHLDLGGLTVIQDEDDKGQSPMQIAGRDQGQILKKIRTVQFQQPESSAALRDSNKEFFKLTLLSMLMNHKSFNTVRSINADALYQEACEKGLPFHEFAKFIDVEIQKYYILKTKNAEPSRFLGREEELADFNGAKLYFDIGEATQTRPADAGNVECEATELDFEMAFSDRKNDAEDEPSLRQAFVDGGEEDKHGLVNPYKAEQATQRRKAERVVDQNLLTGQSFDLLGDKSCSLTPKTLTPKGDVKFSSKFQNMCKSLFGSSITPTNASRKKPPLKLQIWDSTSQGPSKKTNKENPENQDNIP